MPKKYKILLSAYACEPNKGSEPGVGWNWALEIAKRGHDVVVLTRKNNRSRIESVCNIPDNICFEYYDIHKSLMWIKKVVGVHVYYLLWQIGAYFFVKKLLGKKSFELVHHITFVAIRKYSFLAFFGLPFFYGPLGGGESCPKELLIHVSVKDKIKESLRNLLNKTVLINPLSNYIFAKSKLIFTTTDESKNYINKRYKHKTVNFSAIGIGPNDFIINKEPNSSVKILYVGQFLYWKGIQIAMDALKIINNRKIPFGFTLIGKGTFENRLKELAKLNGIDQELNWINWLPQEELSDFYKTQDIFLFPSLHDSGGMVVLEALSYGLPVVCLDIGGPGQIINESCGRVIYTKGRSEKEVVKSLAEAILELQENPDVLQQLRKGAIMRAAEFSWDKTVGRVYDEIEYFMEN